MRKPARAVLTLASAALAIGLTAGVSLAATAATTFKVTPGGSIKGAAGATTVKDTTKSLSLSCKSSSVTGKLKSGKGLAGSGIGTVTALNFASCTVDGVSVSLGSGKVAYSVNATSYASGVTKGTITKIHFVITSSVCNATIDGTGATAHNGKVHVTFTNKTDTLKVLTTDSTLHLYKVSGCLGVIADGNAVTLSASFKLTPKQTIT